MIYLLNWKISRILNRLMTDIVRTSKGMVKAKNDKNDKNVAVDKEASLAMPNFNSCLKEYKDMHCCQRYDT